MPDKRTHRGAHPEDAKLFSPGNIAGLRAAVRDFSLLLTKGYGEKGSLKLVGDKFGLTQRQRLAVLRSACSDKQLSSRKERQVDIGSVAGQSLAVDGYNILITVEAAISSGVIFIGRDGTCRDLASIHGTYRKVSETIPAIELIGRFLNEAGVEKAEWFLDSPVSNSGRLKTLIGKIAAENNWRWDIKLALNPDAELIKTASIVATSDGVVLDGCGRWVNLAAEIINQRIPGAILVDLSGL